MGLQIGEIVPKKEIRLEDLKGKIIAVDAFNTLYQFLANIRQPDGTPLMDDKKRITSHLSGLFYRTTNLMARGIKLVFVFDGKPPAMKGETVSGRIARKEEAREKYEEAKAKGREEEMFKYSRQALHLTDEMIAESKELLKALGLSVVQAPSEGEAQCSYMAKKHDAYAVASQDYDSLAFGAPRLIQNVTLSRKRKLASGAYVPTMPEMIELDTVLNSLQINHDQLICLSILVGTDFNPGGVKGIGPKRALQLVQQYKVPALLFNSLNKLVEKGKIPEPEFNWQDIFELFKKPDVTTDYKIEFKKINETQVKKLLCDEHDFNEERVTSALEKIYEHKEKASQKGLDDF